MRIFTGLFKLSRVCMCMVLVFSALTLYAQESLTVSGTVKDTQGQPVAGASVIDIQTQRGTITDNSGHFRMSVTPTSVLKVSFIGYGAKEVKVSGESTVYDFVLESSDILVDEVVVVGYGVQKKATLTGAVSAVNNKEIVTTKNENVQNMLTGKVAGLRVVQRSSEPGQFNNTMDIRGLGTPLVVIDGVPRTNMARLNSEDIESISVLKDASAAIYGVNGANGVILITTKKGEKDRFNINYSGNMTWQFPSNFPDLLGAVDWMTLANEKQIHNVDLQNPRFSEAEIEEYRNGTKKSTDWKSLVMRDSAPQTQHTINASGGNDRISFYTSFGYQYQGSFLQTDAINYEKYNFRANVSANVTRNIKLDVNLSGMLDETKQTPYGSSEIIRAMWLMQPMDQVWYNEEEGKYWQPKNDGLNNPVTMMDPDIAGWQSKKSKWFQSSATLTYNFPFLKGMYAKATYSYDFIFNDNKYFSKSYTLYRENGTEKVQNFIAEDADYRTSRYYYGKNHRHWYAQLGYDNSFGKHNVSVMALFEERHNDGDNFWGRRNAKLPIDQIFAGETEKMEMNQSNDSGSLYDYAYHSIVGRVNYDYAGKYLAEVTFRADASSRYRSNARWVNTPAFTLGYRISEERFWKNSPLRFINHFKLRGSYGVMSDDSPFDSYSYLQGFNYPAKGTGQTTMPAGSIFGGKYIISSSDTGIPNTAVTWMKTRSSNIGVDIDAWNGLLSVTFDWFSRKRTGMMTRRTGSIPGLLGASLPQENLNSDRTRGFDLDLGHRNRIGRFSYEVRGNVGLTRTKTLYFEQSTAGNSYLNWRNNNNSRYNDIWWGYEGNGRIESWNEIYYNPVFINRGTTLGDYEYVDWNGDGWINDLDVHPIGVKDQAPRVNYGFTISGEWKGLDFSMLFQGAGKRYVVMREFLYQPIWSDTNAVSDFMDRWHPADPTANPYDPATQWVKGEYAYTGSSPNEISSFNIQNAAYLRLKNIEIGYSLPHKWLSKVNIQSLRIYVNAYNLLTFTKLKYIDPEFYVNNDTSKKEFTDYGYNYPLNKTVTIGLNIKF